jgi:hypothetical protein
MPAARADRGTMIDDCPMPDECPGYDRDRGVCLLRPADCEIAPADVESDRVFETADRPAPEPSPGLRRDGTARA